MDFNATSFPVAQDTMKNIYFISLSRFFCEFEHNSSYLKPAITFLPLGNILPPFKVHMANVLVFVCLFIHPADMEQHEQSF